MYKITKEGISEHIDLPSFLRLLINTDWQMTTDN